MLLDKHTTERRRWEEVCHCFVYNYFDEGKVQDSGIPCEGVWVSLVYFSRFFAE